MSTTVCVVEDEEDIREILEIQLKREGYRVILAESGEQGLMKIQEQIPDLILLDLMLPGMNGFDVCRTIRADKATCRIPIIMLTARSEEADIITGLELGADDYVIKPFRPREIIARIRSVLRRNVGRTEDAPTLTNYGPVSIDPLRHRVSVDDRPVDLTATEFKLLAYLVRRPGWVFTRQQIVDAVRGEDYAVTERSVDVQVVGLRKKLAEHADLIETVRGVGYRAKELN